MLYLEDYLELIEHLPTDLRERFTEMREMDLQVQNSTDSLKDKVNKFFSRCNQKKGKISGADQTYEEIRKEYYKALEDADEKVQIANQIYDLVDRHLRKLDQELSKFKMELEADNAGITEVLEQRSLDLDNPSSYSSRSSSRSERKRSSAASNASSNQQQQQQQQSSSSHHHHHHIHHLLPSSSSSSSSSGSSVASPRSSRDSTPQSSSTSDPPPASSSSSVSSSAISNNIRSSSASASVVPEKKLKLPAAAAAAAAEVEVKTAHSTDGKGMTKVTSSSSASHDTSILNKIKKEANTSSPSEASSFPVQHHKTSTAADVKGTVKAEAAELGKKLQKLQEGKGSSSPSSHPMKLNSSKGHSSSSGTGDNDGPHQRRHPPPNLGRHHHRSMVSEMSKHQDHDDSQSSADDGGGSGSRYASDSETPRPSRTKKQTSRAAAWQEERDKHGTRHTHRRKDNNSSSGDDGDGPGDGSSWYNDPHEPRYCVCNQVSYGEMVGCDNKNCPVEWFHYGCVGVNEAPKGKWYCPQCTQTMKRRNKSRV